MSLDAASIALEGVTLSGSWCDLENISIARSGAMFYPLTPCCGASATGSGEEIVCRSCYEEIDSTFGMCWPSEAALLRAIDSGEIREPAR